MSRKESRIITATLGYQMDKLRLTAASKAEKVAILNNPRLLFDKEEELPEVSASGMSSLSHSIERAHWIRLLEIAAKAVSSRQFALAESIIKEIPEADKRLVAWKEYYRGQVKLQQNDTDSAKQLFSASLAAAPISWCFYYYAELCKNENPMQAYEYFVESMRNEPDLDEEAKSHATNWIDGFFNPEVYMRMNPDLSSAPINSPLEHYIQHGFKEERIGGISGLVGAISEMKKRLPEAFNWTQYLHTNNDLQGIISQGSLTLVEAEYLLTRHYLEHGKNEGRTYEGKNDNRSERASETMYKAQKDYLSRKARANLECFLRSSDYIQIGDKGRALITVIVVVHNKAEYTLQAVESIKSSTLQSVALIIVDNNSTDSTKRLISRLSGNVVAIANDYNAHFIRSVNQALSHVKTPYFCLLNNDASLEKGTLDEAIQCLRRHSDCALVGGMVLHSDGYIQDAGSIVFSDGSCRGLGRRASPNHHHFNFERSVDYVSGALLASTITTMENLGGFDERYNPAYYEETDLCFRAHQRKIPVVYCPRLVVRHIEFGSSSSSEQAVAQMAKNREIFRDAHKEQLLTRLRPSSFNEEDIESLLHGHIGVGPRILFIDDRIPQPDLGSGFARAHKLVTELNRLAAHVTMFATDFNRSIATVTHFPEGIECVEGCQDELGRILSNRKDFYDYVFVSREHNQRLFIQIVNQLKENGIALKPTVVFDCESVFSIRNYLFAHLEAHKCVMSTLAGLDLIPVVSEELKRFKAADVITSVSEFECSLIASIEPEKKVVLLGHPFLELGDTSLDLDERDAITFLGAIHEEVSPNHDSLIWMKDEILPALAEMPLPTGLKIQIAGNITCEQSRQVIAEIQHSFDFVDYVGLVDDLTSLFSRSRAFIAPTRYAAGVPHKVHLASSFGVPSISTLIVAEQMGWSDDNAIITANTGRDFAKLICRCYEDYTLFEETRKRMRAAFNRDCSQGRFVGNLRDILGT